MNWKHLLWIIPLCLILGGYLGLRLFGGLLDFTMTELASKAGEKLIDAQLAWEEKLEFVNSTRIVYEGKFCYKYLGKIICPERNITALYEEY
jgi:hypothetical protein